MELVYLWVEEYKNIHNQGFNFSPKFNCHYDPDTNALTIDENNDYIDNFFGDNINVTAIVGKNGSGKSSVFEFILDRLANRDNIYPKNFIILYKHENKIYQYSNFKYKTDDKVNIDEYPNGENLLEFYQNIIAIHINSEYKDVEVRDTQSLFSENNKYDKNSSNIVFIENYVFNGKLLKKLKEKIFTPDYLQINIKTVGLYISILYEDGEYYADEDWKEIETLINSMKNNNFIERLKIIQNIFILKYNRHKNKDKIIHFRDRNSPNKYLRFNDELFKSIPDVFQDSTEQNIKINIEQLDKEILEYIQKLPYIYEIDLFDKNKINIDNLSFGEKQLLTQLHYILKHVTSKTYNYYVPPYQAHDVNGEPEGDEQDDYYKKIDIQSCLIFLDEFEIGLHPEWQKKTIKYIIDFLEVVDIKTHLILTSHSPFLLSDIPKQNIIFLDKDEKGNCKVVNGLKEKKQTFGANIHTLLSDSFFMEDGLMGEFAKGKINEIIDFHKVVEKEKHATCLKKIYEKRKIKFWQTQSIIGEEYLKQIIKNHLVEIEKTLLGKDEAKSQEVERTKAYLEQLEND